MPIGGLLSGLFQGAKALLPSLLPTIGKVGKGVWNGFKKLIGAGEGATPGDVGGGLGRGAGGRLGDWAGDRVGEIGGRFGDWVGGHISPELGARIGRRTGEAGDWLRQRSREYGEQLGRGVGDWAESQIGNLGNQFRARTTDYRMEDQLRAGRNRAAWDERMRSGGWGARQTMSNTLGGMQESQNLPDGASMVDQGGMGNRVMLDPNQSARRRVMMPQMSQMRPAVMPNGYGW